MKKRYHRRISLIACLGFFLQLLAVGACQMGASSVATAADHANHSIHQAMSMDAVNVATVSMHHAGRHAMSGEPATDSEHGTPCSHCNQPDELASVVEMSNLSHAEVVLLSAYIQSPLDMALAQASPFVSFPSLNQQPDRTTILYRTSQRIRI